MKKRKAQGSAEEEPASKQGKGDAKPKAMPKATPKATPKAKGKSKDNPSTTEAEEGAQRKRKSRKPKQ